MQDDLAKNMLENNNFLIFFRDNSCVAPSELIFLCYPAPGFAHPSGVATAWADMWQPPGLVYSLLKARRPFT